MSLVQVFEQLIAAEWKLERRGSDWLVVEPNSENNLLRVGGGRSFAFSLDQKGRDRFPFMRPNTPLVGVRSTCDAIVVADFDGDYIVVAIEMKTKEADKGDAMKQIEAGRHWLQWIFNLIRMHGHWRNDCRFCSVVSLKPRRQVRKGITSRRSMPVLPSAESGRCGEPMFVLKNHPKLNLSDLINALAPSAAGVCL